MPSVECRLAFKSPFASWASVTEQQSSLSSNLLPQRNSKSSSCVLATLVQSACLCQMASRAKYHPRQTSRSRELIEINWETWLQLYADIDRLSPTTAKASSSTMRRSSGRKSGRSNRSSRGPASMYSLCAFRTMQWPRGTTSHRSSNVRASILGYLSIVQGGHRVETCRPCSQQAGLTSYSASAGLFHAAQTAGP